MGILWMLFGLAMLAPVVPNQTAQKHETGREQNNRRQHDCVHNPRLGGNVDVAVGSILRGQADERIPGGKPNRPS